MPATYEPIATTTLSSAAASITFSSIPATYTDLKLIFVPVGNGAAIDAFLQFNSVTSGTNYSQTRLIGNGANALSSRFTNQSKIFLDTLVSGTIPSLYNIDIFSYTGSTFKTVLWSLSEDKNGSGVASAQVGLFSSTSAIDRIDLGNAGTMGIGTTATLYGILRA